MLCFGINCSMASDGGQFRTRNIFFVDLLLQYYYLPILCCCSFKMPNKRSREWGVLLEVMRHFLLLLSGNRRLHKALAYAVVAWRSSNDDARQRESRARGAMVASITGSSRMPTEMMLRHQKSARDSKPLITVLCVILACFLEDFRSNNEWLQ